MLLVACTAEETAPTIATFTATPESIEAAGEFVTLSWDVSGAPTLRLEPGAVDVTGLDEYTVQPSETTTYTLIATNPVGQRTRYVVVRLGSDELPVIASFSASPATFAAPGDPVALSWSVSGATSLRLEPGAVDVTGLDGYTVQPSETTTYTLIATNPVGQRTHDTVVRLGSDELPVIASFSASPATFAAPGDPVALSWSVSGATSLRLEPGELDVSDRSGMIVNPDATTTYTLIASNEAGQQTREVTVTLDPSVDPQAPVITSFEPVATLVNPGLPNTLRWSVDGADTLILSGPGVEDGVDVTGTTQWGPSAALPPGAVFSLTASNAHGVATRPAAASRVVPTFSVLVAGQSNAQGVNLSATDARSYIAAAASVHMLGNDYDFKQASEPLDDCLGQVDTISLDSQDRVTCSSFETSNTSGVSFGVSLGNALTVTTGGDVILIPAALGGSSALQWAMPTDPTDRTRLFGSANHRARLVGSDLGAPVGHTYAGSATGAIAWFQGETDTSSLNQTNSYYVRADAVFDAFREQLGAPIILAQLSRRGPTNSDPDGSQRNLFYQRVRETQRRMVSGARTLSGAPASEAEAGRHLVVTHDLPLADGDGRHLSAEGQVELGRRYALAIREHLLGESVDGTGPRLVRVQKSSNTVVRVETDRVITEPVSVGAQAYASYFAVFSQGDAVPVSDIRRDPDDPTTVRITLATDVSGELEVRYMPPPGLLLAVEADVVRAASCGEPMPGTNLCLPLPAFGMATDAITGDALRSLQFEFD